MSLLLLFGQPTTLPPAPPEPTIGVYGDAALDVLALTAILLAVQDQGGAASANVLGAAFAVLTQAAFTSGTLTGTTVTVDTMAATATATITTGTAAVADQGGTSLGTLTGASFAIR